MTVAIGLAAAVAFALVTKAAPQEAQRSAGRAEKALLDDANGRRQYEWLDRLSELAGDALVVLDGRGTVVFGNPTAAQLLGMPASDLLGRPHHDVLLHSEPGKVECSWDQCPFDSTLERGTVHRITSEELWRTDGSRLPVTFISAPVLQQGRTAGAVIVIRDRSPETRVAQQVRQQQQVTRELELEKGRLVQDIEDLTARLKLLEHSNEELERFAYVAAHDLQEPLRMVASYTQLLAKRYKGRLDEDADEYIGYAVSGATRMKLLINDLLDYARVSSLGEPFAPVDCNGALREALNTLHLSIEESGAQITPEELPTIPGDARQLIRVFENLIGNALKYRSEAPPLVHISVQPTEHFWIFSVSDNGIGIEPQYADSIFDVFRRLHSQDEYPGTGIGLAICRKIVRRHGGEIWVESQIGQGSTFRFRIPKIPRSVLSPQTWAAALGELQMAPAPRRPQAPTATVPGREDKDFRDA